MIQLIVFWFAGVILFFAFLALLMKLVRKIAEKRHGQSGTGKKAQEQDHLSGPQE